MEKFAKKLLVEAPRDLVDSTSDGNPEPFKVDIDGCSKDGRSELFGMIATGLSIWVLLAYIMEPLPVSFRTARDSESYIRLKMLSNSFSA